MFDYNSKNPKNNKKKKDYKKKINPENICDNKGRCYSRKGKLEAVKT